MVDVVEALKTERRSLEVRLNAINAYLDSHEGSAKPASGKKRHLTAAGRRALSLGAKRMWAAKRAKAKAAKKAKAQ